MKKNIYQICVFCMVLVFFTGNHPVTAKPLTIAGSPNSTDPYYPTYGNGGYDAKSYSVNLRYQPRTHWLTSSTTMTALASNNLRSFNLDLLGFRIISVSVNGQPAQFARSGAHELTIYPPHFLPKGKNFVSTINYQGVPNQINKNNSVGWQYSSSGGAFVAGQPQGALTWFPVNEVVTDKALFSVTATVPKQFQVISNGIKTQERIVNSNRIVTWKTTNPMASYLATIGIDKWKFLFQKWHQIPLVSAFAPGQTDKIALEKHLPKILELLEKYFGPYPLEAGGGIFVADKINFSLETQTRPIYASWTDLDTVVHENTHQWWGDAVSVKSWKDTCLNECMASYGAYLWDESAERLNLDNWYTKAILLRRYNPGFWANQLYDMGAGKEFSMNGVYTKGPLFIHALRRQVGDKVFIRTLHYIQAKYHNKNASMLDFENAFINCSKQDLREFFRQWLGNKRPADKFLYPTNLATKWLPKDINTSDLEGSLTASLT